MSAEEKLEDVRLGTDTEFSRLFIVTNPVDASGATVDVPFDSELIQKAGFGTSVSSRPGAFAGRPNVVESFDNFAFMVEVPYKAPTALNPGLGGAWHMRMSGGLESLRTDVELLTPEEIADGIVPTVVGAFDFRRADTTVTVLPPNAPVPTYFTAGKDGIRLQMPNQDPATWKRIPVGMDREVAIDSITLSKIFNDASESRISDILSHRGRINSDTMSLPGLRTGAFAPEQALLSGYELDNVVGGNSDDPLVHSISLTFTIRSDGWRNPLVHTWTDPDVAGSASVVVLTESAFGPHEAGEPVIDNFRRQFQIPFNGWLEAL